MLVQEQVFVCAAAAAAQLPAEGEAGLGHQGADRDGGQLRRRPQHAQEALHQANFNHEGSECEYYSAFHPLVREVCELIFWDVPPVDWQKL